LTGTLPEVWDALLAAGGVPARPPGFPAEMTGLECRRSTFERALWAAARREPRLALRTGHADRPVTRNGRLTGVTVDGQTVDADLVIAATGRASRFAAAARAPAEGGACGFSYVARMYRARPGTELASSGIPMASLYRGYLAMVFARRAHPLGAHRPAHGRRRARATAAHPLLRRRRAAHPPARTLDRPRPVRADHRRHGRRRPDQHLPRPARQTRPRGHPGPVLHRRHRVHHLPRRRTRRLPRPAPGPDPDRPAHQPPRRPARRRRAIRHLVHRPHPALV